MPQIERDYIATGKVRYIFKDFPLEAIHREAFKAHEVANCAGEQGKYWEMHDMLFSNTTVLGLNDLKKYAQTLGLKSSKFSECLESGKYTSEIREDLAEGQNAGVGGTPTFFLGLTGPDSSSVRVTIRITGAQPYPNFKEAIESLLSIQNQ